MHARIAAFLFVACVFGGQVAPAAAENSTWLPLGRQQIMQVFHVVALKEMQDDKNSPRDVSMLRKAGDTVWVGINKDVQFRLAMAGQGNNIHSIRIFVPIVNLSPQQADAMSKMLIGFFEAEFPDWHEAKDWPAQSMSSSWSATGNAMDRKPFDPSAIITKKTINGITISTFGVPPDIILYAATARDVCIPKQATSSDPKDDPIQRLVC